MIPPNAENGNFSKITYVNSNYNEAVLYRLTQPLDKRKKGFGSKDAHRTDEFSSANRTEQYRESMKKEMELMKKNATQQIAALESTGAFNNTYPESQRKNEHLFDIGRTKVTEFDPKSTRDRYYKFDTNNDKRVGTYRPESTTVGIAAWNTEYKPPSHGAASLVKVIIILSILTLQYYLTIFLFLELF
jgi:hypothetical protein